METEVLCVCETCKQPIMPDESSVEEDGYLYHYDRDCIPPEDGY